MNLSDIITFRKDLLFDGAVQISWFESNKELADKAAMHYVFHGPEYHGFSQDEFIDSEHNVVDTATFTLDTLKLLSGLSSGDPFTLAVAGYGTGKSHLGVTLASLLSCPQSCVAQKILDNLKLADKNIGAEANRIMADLDKPFLVVTLNGMKDFYLCGEIIRQIMAALNRVGLDTSMLANLRPRFKTAATFTKSFCSVLKEEFTEHFGNSFEEADIINSLNNQDEDVFKKVNMIYERRIGESIPSTGQEALQEFITKTRNYYCGSDKPFAGIIILFDEFGRYLEFSVQKPYIAGSGALQQLFEAVQENAESVFLLGFIQYELKAYISRIAPELREDLNRYVSRYEIARKIRLSSNLETLIANLLEKKNIEELGNQIAAIKDEPGQIQASMTKWFPEMNNHAIWADQEQFKNVIVKGCWPLHPLSTWVLYKLSALGKSLQERSALFFLEEVTSKYKNVDCPPGMVVVPVELCSDGLIDEFLSTEQYGQQGATAHAYQSAIHKYQHELSEEQSVLLKAVLLSSKVGFKVESKEECMRVISKFSGINPSKAEKEISYLESEFAVLEWNETLHRFEISGDSVPKKAFVALLDRKAGKIGAESRAIIFSKNYMKWSGIDVLNTNFGPENEIFTNEWNYKVSFSCISLLGDQIDSSLSNWIGARGADEAKGQLIYCYVGPESTEEEARRFAVQTLNESMEKISTDIDMEIGAPLAILLLHDADGSFGQKVARRWVMGEQLDKEDRIKYQNFIFDLENSLEQEMTTLFSKMELLGNIIFATKRKVKNTGIIDMLTDLFDVIYDQRIPFPFDGFHTTRGHAAKDSQQFTSQLLLGRFDREWISAQSKQQKNRAYAVLDKSWGVLSEDGSTRVKPTNAAIRNIIDLLESILPASNNGKTDKVMNLGVFIRLLCAPPYGCNLASAGLLLAYYIGKRKDEFNILMDGRAIGFEKWLQEALSGRFFELPILDKSYLMRVNKESLSEWEELLETWEDEKNYSTKCNLLVKAEKLRERVPVPQDLHYRYKLLQEQSEQALKKIYELDDKIDSCLKRIGKGVEQNDVGKLSWGGADLVNILADTNERKELWTDSQIRNISNQIQETRTLIQKGFRHWLSRFSVDGIEQLGRFMHISSQIDQNLSKLNLPEEQRLLKEHAYQIEKNIQLISKINSVLSDINNMVERNYVTNNTPVSVLDMWLQQAEEFEKRLELAADRPRFLQADIGRSSKTLREFKQKCQKQLLHLKERMRKVFDIQSLSGSDLEYWRIEIAALKVIYEGFSKDVEDLDQVLKHIDLIDSHIAILSNHTLTAEEFTAACESCMEETEQYFSDDAPPLDHESIYSYLKNEIMGNRERAANDWFLRNVPEEGYVNKIDASRVYQIQKELLQKPKILSKEQVDAVNKAIKACGKRLDELEVEGLLARFKTLSADNKKRFMELAFKELN